MSRIECRIKFPQNQRCRAKIALHPPKIGGRKTAQEKKTNSWERRFPGTFRTNVPLILPIFSVFSVGGGPKVPRNFVPGNFFFSYFRWFFYTPKIKVSPLSSRPPCHTFLSFGAGMGAKGGSVAAGWWRAPRHLRGPAAILFIPRDTCIAKRPASYRDPKPRNPKFLRKKLKNYPPDPDPKFLEKK